MRNILARVPHREKGRFAAHLKQIWLQPDKTSARRAADALIEDYGKRFPEALSCLEEGLEDSLSFYDFPEVDKKRISSCYLIEYSEDWENDRSYIREDKVRGSLDRLHERMAQAAN